MRKTQTPALNSMQRVLNCWCPKIAYSTVRVGLGKRKVESKYASKKGGPLDIKESGLYRISVQIGRDQARSGPVKLSISLDGHKRRQFITRRKKDNLVVRQSLMLGLMHHPVLILGYSLSSFVRASSICICQSAPRCFSLVASAHAEISWMSSSNSPMRLPLRH